MVVVFCTEFGVLFAKERKGYKYTQTDSLLPPSSDYPSTRCATSCPVSSRHPVLALFLREGTLQYARDIG